MSKIEENSIIINEIITTLKNPENLLPSFMVKYSDNKEVLSLFEDIRKYKEVSLRESQSDLDVVAILKDFKSNNIFNKNNRGFKKTHLFSSINESLGSKELCEINKSKIISKSRIISKRVWTSIAALIVIFVSSFLFVMNYRKSDSKTFVENNIEFAESNIKIGKSSSVTLVTSYGKEYSINKVNTINDTLLNKIILVKNEGLIIYKDTISNNKSLSNIYNTIKVPRFGEYKVILSDGTSVMLNAESELKYPVKFYGKNRIVELKGEAYFEVAHNPLMPFIVKTSSIDTKVLGTKFNVDAYENEDVNITLVQGKIALYVGKSIKNRILKPNENAHFSIKNKILSVEEVDLDEYIGWKNGFFYFNRVNLDDILTTLSRWYDFKVIYINNYVKNYEFRIRVSRTQTFDEIIKSLERTNRISLVIKDKIIYIKDVKRL